MTQVETFAAVIAKRLKEASGRNATSTAIIPPEIPLPEFTQALAVHKLRAGEDYFLLQTKELRGEKEILRVQLLNTIALGNMIPPVTAQEGKRRTFELAPEHIPATAESGISLDDYAAICRPVQPQKLVDVNFRDLFREIVEELQQHAGQGEAWARELDAGTPEQAVRVMKNWHNWPGKVSSISLRRKVNKVVFSIFP